MALHREDHRDCIISIPSVPDIPSEWRMCGAGQFLQPHSLQPMDELLIRCHSGLLDGNGHGLRTFQNTGFPAKQPTTASFGHLLHPRQHAGHCPDLGHKHVDGQLFPSLYVNLPARARDRARDGHCRTRFQQLSGPQTSVFQIASSRDPRTHLKNQQKASQRCNPEPTPSSNRPTS